MISGCTRRFLNAVVAVVLAGCHAGCLWGSEPSDVFAARELTTEQALAVVTRQSTKPSLNDVKDEVDVSRLLAAAGLPAERIAAFRDAIRGLEPWPLLDASYHTRLVEFLLRTTDPRWLRMADEFAEVRYLPRLDRLSPEAASRLAGRDRPGSLVLLPALGRLDPETARALCHDRSIVVLPAITRLTPDLARAMAGGMLVSLPGLASLEPDAARPLLVTGEERLSAVLLTGLDDVPPALADVLASTRKLLVLRGPKRLDPATIELLAGNDQIRFDLGLVRELTPALAGRLASRSDGGMLRLPGVTTLTVATAERLAECSGGVSLPGLASLSPETAAMLARCQSGVELPGLATISPDVARALATCTGDVSLPGLQTIPPAVAAALPEWKGFVSLGGLRTLSEADARSLTATTAAIRLPGVTELSLDVATILGKVRWLELPGLRSLDAQTAAALAAGPGVLRLDGLTTLTPESAQGLVGQRGTLMLSGLTALDAAAARTLAAGRPVELRFGRPLRTLSPEAADSLAAHRGQVLLPGLADPPAEVADRLVQNEKILFDLGCYAARKTLTPEVAAALAKRHEEMSLDGIESFESRDAVKIATALAAKQGPLALPNLKKLSPKTLLALAAKEDLEMPPVEDLELIDEPDGSPTEDFVIPERLERRTKQAD